MKNEILLRSLVLSPKMSWKPHRRLEVNQEKGNQVNYEMRGPQGRFIVGKDCFKLKGPRKLTHKTPHPIPTLEQSY